MRCVVGIFALLLFTVCLVANTAGTVATGSDPYATVIVPKAKTSIYVGSVTLAMTPFQRGADGVYTADYKASVVPFFIFNESGNLRITFTAEQIAKLERSERVEFSGMGKTTKGSERRIAGHATADAPGSKTGKIKVRVFVTKKTELIFNTTYAFAEAPPATVPTP